MRSCLRHRLPRCAVPRCLHRPAFAPCHVTLAALPRCAVRCLGPDACHATAMRSCLRHRPRCSQRPLPWPRCLHPCLRAHAFRSRPASSLPAMSRYRDAQLPSPSAPMQSKTALDSPAGSWLPASRLPLPACVFAPGHVTLPRCAVAFAISPDAVQDRFRLSCGKLFTFRLSCGKLFTFRLSCGKLFTFANRPPAAPWLTAAACRVCASCRGRAGGMTCVNG
jgi:hypothetical protein